MESKNTGTKTNKEKKNGEAGSAMAAMSAALDNMVGKKKGKKAETKTAQAATKLKPKTKTSKAEVVKEPLATKVHKAAEKIVFPKELLEKDIIVSVQGKTTNFLSFPSMSLCIQGLSKISRKHIIQNSVLECALGIRSSHCGFTFEFADANVKYDKTLNPYLSHSFILVRMDDGFVAYVNNDGVETCTMDIYTISSALKVMPKQVYRAAVAIEENDISSRVFFMLDNVRYFVAFADEVEGDRKGLYKWCKIQESERRLFPSINGVIYTNLEEACGMINSALQAEGWDDTFSMEALNAFCYNSIYKGILRFSYVTAREALTYITKSTVATNVANKEHTGVQVAQAFMQNKHFITDCFADIFSKGVED